MRKNEIIAVDRGPARHFHGRKNILSAFSKQLRWAVSAKFRENGTIFLIQGSPGAGKTALLYKCSDLAETGGAEVGGKKWRVVDIDYSALHSPTALMKQAGKTYTYGKTTEKSGHAAVTIPVVGGAGAEFKRTHQSADDDMMDVVNKLSKKQPLLLMLDEVQEIRKLSAEKLEILTKTLFRIHNGKTRYPVVFLCRGLGISGHVFRRLGISRFRRNCVVNLGQLSAVNERAVIRDWLVKDGGAREEDIAPWIRAIARETHGWPQHIMAYVQAAADLLLARNGRMTPEDLDTVMRQGRQEKRIYYRARSEDFSDTDVEVLAHIFWAGYGGIKKSQLLKGFMSKGPMSQAQAEHLFEEFLHKGVLSNAETEFSFYYDIPIPSMKDYLFEAAGLKAKSPERG